GNGAKGHRGEAGVESAEHCFFLRGLVLFPWAQGTRPASRPSHGALEIVTKSEQSVNSRTQSPRAGYQAWPGTEGCSAPQALKSVSTASCRWLGSPSAR